MWNCEFILDMYGSLNGESADSKVSTFANFQDDTDAEKHGLNPCLEWDLNFLVPVFDHSKTLYSFNHAATVIN